MKESIKSMTKSIMEEMCTRHYAQDILTDEMYDFVVNEVERHSEWDDDTKTFTTGDVRGAIGKYLVQRLGGKNE